MVPVFPQGQTDTFLKITGLGPGGKPEFCLVGALFCVPFGEETNQSNRTNNQTQSDIKHQQAKIEREREREREPGLRVEYLPDLPSLQG